MSDAMPAVRIRNVLSGGSAEHGETVVVTFATADGAQFSLAIPLDLMPRLVGNLGAYAKMADQARAGVPAGQIATVMPYKITGITGSGASSDGETIGLMLKTSDGLPLELAMSRDHADETIERLQSELDRPVDPTAGRH